MNTTIRSTMYGLQTGLNLCKVMRADAPAPTPAPPSADVDFTTLDTEEKAILLPTLNPAALGVLLGGVSALTAPGAQPVNVSFQFGKSTPGQVSYQVVQDNKSPGLIAKGNLGAADFNERWSVEEPNGKLQLHIMGNVGAYAEDLVITPSPKERVFQVDGKIGNFALHETLSPAGSDQAPYLIADGTLNNIPLHMEVRPDGSNPNAIALTTTGNLGDRAIHSTVATTTANGAVVVSGQGNIAGTDFTVSTSVPAKH